MKRGRIYRAVRGVVIFLPAFLFLCALGLPFIPGAMGLFTTGAGPWYQPVTAPLFFAALIYAYPITFLCTRLLSDDMFLSPGYYVVLAIYTALWIWVLRTIFRFFERRQASRSGDRASHPERSRGIP